MIYDGSKEISMIYDGNKELVAVYDGAKEVWSNAKIINLGNAMSFNVSSLYNKYNELTEDNFFYLSMEDSSGASGVTWPGYTVYVSLWGPLHKSYDSSTGVLRTGHVVNSNSGDSWQNAKNCQVVLVTNPDKSLIKLNYRSGDIKTYDIKSAYPNDYTRFTNDNFLVKADARYRYLRNSSINYEGYYEIRGTHKLIKSYDSSTGILTCYYDWHSYLVNYSSDYDDDSQSAVAVYLNPKV